MSFATTVHSTLMPYVHQATSHVQSRPFLTASIVGSVSLLTYYIHDSYRGFLAIGPGGLPHNFWGWFVQASLQPFGRRDTIDSSPFHDAKIFQRYDPHGRTSFLTIELPVRAGSRPTVPGYVAPQRQTSEQGDAALVERMNSWIANLARTNPDFMEIKASGLEHKSNPALWLKRESQPEYAKMTKGEIVHVHPEGSTHLILSLVDAGKATEQRWAQLHKLSGVALPHSYVMVYAPRDETEFQVWQQLILAAIAFNTSGAVVNI